MVRCLIGDNSTVIDLTRFFAFTSNQTSSPTICTGETYKNVVKMLFTLEFVVSGAAGSAKLRLAISAS